MDLSLVLGQSCQLVIIIVPVEKGLHGVATEIAQIVFEFGVIYVFPLLIDVFLVKIVFHRRDERSSQPLFVEFLPREIAEPWMAFYFLRSAIAKSVLRFSLDHFVHKVSGFNTPASGYFALFDLDLFRQNMVSDFLSRLSNVGSSSEHAFVRHDSHCEIVD